MKKILFLSFLFVLMFPLMAIGQDKSFSQPVELVESIPLETMLDSPSIRNAPDVWLDMIKEAQKTLDIEVFYICNEKGHPLENIINAIKEAATRGVTVRIISDSKFYETYPETLDELNKVPNISVRIIPLIKLTDGVMHAKYFISDGKDVFLGSQNFDWKALNQIHEIGIRIRDEKFGQTVEKIFNLDWLICEAKDKSEYLSELEKTVDVLNSKNTLSLQYKDETITLYPAFSPVGLIYKDMSWDEDAITDMINNAKEEVCIQVMDYSPAGRDKTFYPVLDNALRSAAVRGVKVKMIVANWSNKKPAIDFIKSLSLVPNIEIKISNIPEWSGGFIEFARVEHCKYMIVDSDSTWIGTSNWEKNYFYNCRNLSVAVKSKIMNSELKEVFYKDWNGPYTEKVDPVKEYKAPKVKN